MEEQLSQKGVYQSNNKQSIDEEIVDVTNHFLPTDYEDDEDEDAGATSRFASELSSKKNLIPISSYKKAKQGMGSRKTSSKRVKSQKRNEGVSKERRSRSMSQRSAKRSKSPCGRRLSAKVLQSENTGRKVKQGAQSCKKLKGGVDTSAMQTDNSFSTLGGERVIKPPSVMMVPKKQ